MSGIICHHNGKYNVYSPVSDGFIFESSLTPEQLTYWVEREHGKSGLEKLPKRLERAHKNGHSALEGSDLDSFLSCNRAGPNERRLTTAECIKRFLS